MNIVIKDTNYKIKYGYLVVSKSEIVSKVVNTMSKMGDGEVAPEFLQELMSTVADMLLYGLQKAHADEYGFDYITGKGYEEKYAKVCDLIDDFIDEDGKVIDLFNSLSEELLNKGFLGQMTEEVENQEVQTSNLQIVNPSEQN